MNDDRRGFLVFDSEILDGDFNGPVVTEHGVEKTQAVIPHLGQPFQTLRVLPFVSLLEFFKQVPQLPLRCGGAYLTTGSEFGH